MKTQIAWSKNLILGAGLTLASFLIFAGCASPVTTPGTPAVTAAQVTPAQPAQIVLQVQPATATAPAVTNYIQLPAQPAVTNYVTVTPAVPPTTTYVPNTTVMQGVALANQAAPLIPAPYGTILTGVASMAALIAGWFANKKNNEATAATASSAAMASVIAPVPALVTQALNAAVSNGSTATVATHIAAANSPT